MIPDTVYGNIIHAKDPSWRLTSSSPGRETIRHDTYTCIVTESSYKSAMEGAASRRVRRLIRELETEGLL